MNTTMNRTIVALDEMTSAEELRSGAKAYNCARLKQAGFRVPAGIVVLSSAAEDDVASVADHPWFDGLPAGALFAVRSSGIGEDGEGQSFAGIHETVLNVSRQGLRDAVAVCQTSGRSKQALEYRRANGISMTSIEMGVLIQRMIQPVAAGVAFTVNPITGATTELVINASWGLGEALVSGQLDPDEFVVRKHDGELMWRRIGDKGGSESSLAPSLTTEQVHELAAILIDIEDHYGAPQDVEWCHDGHDFWIVQSRPVTSRRSTKSEIEWSRANLAEVLPDLTSPQALSAFEDLLNRSERESLGKVAAPETELGPLLKSFYGRLYFNLTQMRRLCAFGGVAPAEMLRSMGHAESIKRADEQPVQAPIREKLSAAPDLLRIAWNQIRAARFIQEHEARVEKDLQRLTATDPQCLSDSEIWSHIEQWLLCDGPAYLQTVFLLSGVSFLESPVRGQCKKVGFPYEQLVYPQLAVGERSVSAQQAFDLITLAAAARREPAVVDYLCNENSDLSQINVALRGTAFMDEFEGFLQLYGHRGRYESDWSLPRYAEDPSPLLRAIRAHLLSGSEKTPSEIMMRQQRESADAWAAFEQRLTWLQKRITLPRIRKSIRQIKQYYVWRERVRSDIVRVLAQVRRLSLALAGRFVERGWLDNRDDYFLLHLEEIRAVILGYRPSESLRALAADRSAEMARYRTIQMPLLMCESELSSLIRTAGISSRSDDESQFTGHPVSGGCVEAEVVVVRDPGDFGRMKPGAILVAPATDPSWTPLFTLASGVIVEVGGVLSHASTVAREYGLPALANVKHATKRLKTGERVRLDAINGVVQRI
jgi:rifampicin phosphotransferase